MEPPAHPSGAPSADLSLDDPFSAETVRPTAAPSSAAPSPSVGPSAPTTPLSSYSSQQSVRSVAAEQASPRGALRFVPGRVVGGRYRVIGLLGRGGMGEVYRADDLRLGEPVALKFLPEDLSQDGAALARFHREVKVARNVAHPNVCRVYDIGEVAGQPYLSMEYIDGEDLATLLRRIGRLAPDKALQLGRQLCAGLAAAHEQGVLHRDLKPANVMIDGRGRAKITDFGIAGLEGELSHREIAEGTPAYQSPEQLAGREVTARSDLYALGLLLFELFAGRRAFPARSKAELVKMQQEGPPESLAALAPGVDPLIETAILRCLDPEPKRRPSSAVQVAALLPGGDPLAAAMAAGETPSPEMVAAAPKTGTLSWPLAVVCLLGVVVSLGAAAFLQQRVFLEQRLASASPSSLAFRAEQVAERLSVGAGAADRAWGWKLETRALSRLPAAAPGQPRPMPRPGWPPIFGLWYRTSPQPMESLDGYVRVDDPPLALPGDAVLRVGVDGRLWRLERVPERLGVGAPAGPVDWTAFFAEAGLDPSAFREAEPRWDPPQRTDRRRAWSGTAAAEPETPLRVEAAALRGVPVWFEVMEEDAEPVDMAPRSAVMTTQIFWWLIAFFYVVVLGASLLLARRNLRQGRGDRQGAVRVAAVLFAALAFEAVVSSHHVGGLAELRQLMRLLGTALFQAACVWLGYLALEPIIRRRWPQRIIGWSRALAGDLSDPMVGREVLFGVLLGLATGAVRLAAAWGLPLPAGYLVPVELGMWLPAGWTKVGQFLAASVSASLLVPISALLFIVLLTVVVRRTVYAALAFWLLFAMVLMLGTGEPEPLVLLGELTAAGLFTLALTRVGLLAAACAYLTVFVSGAAPLSLDPSAWYFPYGAAAALLALALAGWGFAVSLGDRVKVDLKGLLE
jgi:serine/threonine-protein kinase